MGVSLESKPRVSYEFEVEKVIGISSDGSYQVRWAPVWVSRFHLVGCEHLIQEFLQEQQSGIESKIHSEIHHVVPHIISEMRSGESPEACEDQELLPAQSELEIKTEPDIELEVGDNPDPAQETKRKESEVEVQLGLSEEAENMHSNVSIVIPGANSHQTALQQTALQPASGTMKKAKDSDKSTIIENRVESKDSGAAGTSSEINIHQNEPQYSSMRQINMAHPTYMPPVSQCFCNTCSKELPCRCALEKHMIKHSPGRRYRCPHCPKSFKQSGHLKTHLRFHSGVRPYSCNQCDYSCVQKSDLTKHIRTHTGEKPYVCGVCSKSFSSKCNLNSHVHSYH